MTNFQCISTELYPGNGEPIDITVDTLSHRDGVAHLCKGFDIAPEDWPDGYGISNEIITLSSHQGTHVDAPLHYHPDGHSIAEADIEEFMGKAVMFTDTRSDGHQVDLDWDAYIAKLDAYSGEAKAVFFITGAYRRYGDKSYFLDFKGVPAKYVAAALDRGYSLIGTDAFSLDPPFATMSEEFVQTGKQSALWPAHVLGRSRPYYQIERLANLEPFENTNLVEFIALPIKLHCGASWARAVARILE
ncbi:MAG: cyclase family protein [Paracoccaceae bacterium]